MRVSAFAMFFVRDLVLLALIGVHDHEHDKPQRVRVNLDLAVREGENGLDDDLANVVCYEQLVSGVQKIFDQAMSGLSKRLPRPLPRCAWRMFASVRHGCALKSLIFLTMRKASGSKSNGLIAKYK